MVPLELLEGTTLDGIIDLRLERLFEDTGVWLLEGTVEWLLELLEGTTLDETVVLMLEELLRGTVEWLLDGTVEWLLAAALETLLEVIRTDEEVTEWLFEETLEEVVPE